MPDPPRILVVDDDADTLLLLEEILTKEGYRVRTAEHAEAALSLASQEEPDVVVTDIQMPGMDGLALLAELQRRLPQTLVVLATAFGSLKTAVDGIKAGAFDYLGKPFVVDDIRLVVRRAIEHKRVINENAALREQLKERYRFDNFVGSSAGMIAVYKMIARVAQSDSTVLIQGESGTGKELVARAIHANSLRSAGPFVAVDAGTLAESLLESELFGHERGSFTGALTTKKGLLERAHSGTCFLDEIADISPTLQSKLLRVIQEREIRRVGGSDPISVDVRILAASNKDLKGLVDAGKFRGDLYYRLNVVTISIPPLRERADDIPLLAQFFAQKYGAAQGKPAIGISADAMDLITKYVWPGNVRELEHVIERAVVLTPHPVIFPEDLPEALREKPIADSQPRSGWVTLDQLERDYILRALAAHQQDQAKTADLLGIHRKTLQRKLRKYGLAEAGAIEEGSTADEAAVEQEESI
ncbi:Regulatory protein AtoC [Nitrospira tepida]|uniref:Regulatory protein AtoC n=1 Tax=Nitrospira tepida TaxID=2973512 RepID=A0AA86N0B6_9BACT|nr:sigma-54 dependent transcriptional regulator [Nitrospira tepida]CAI4032337.1 Regulatory protein AtoC [Nitrospira tepida]